MTDPQASLLLKRPVTLKVIVTDRWKEEAQEQLQAQISQLDGQLQQLDRQGQRAITEIQRQSIIQPLDLQAKQQLESIQAQVNQQRSQLLERKNQTLQQLQQVQILELEQEIAQGQMESYCRIDVGDNLINKLNLEVVVRDGVVLEIRGEV
ncbi:MAG: hypothetical protein HC890_03585 [Chloroflexaceae bacterium]|nr:hypothetical protein [Chloroflexaceae bacterium]